MERWDQRGLELYLIEESGKLVLVDAGAPKDWALFTRAVLGFGEGGW